MESWSRRSSPGDNSPPTAVLPAGTSLAQEFGDRDRLVREVRNVMVFMLLEQLVKEEHHEKRLEDPP